MKEFYDEFPKKQSKYGKKEGYVSKFPKLQQREPDPQPIMQISHKEEVGFTRSTIPSSSSAVIETKISNIGIGSFARKNLEAENV